MSTAHLTTSDPVLSLLARFALAIARRRAYGDVHPMVAEADGALADALVQHIEAQSSFALAVANRDLLVDGAPVTGSPAVVRDLALRLHLLGIGAVRFQRGLSLTALSQFVGLLARRRVPGEAPPALPELQGIIVGRVDYEQLGLADEASLKAEGLELWRVLATRVLQHTEGLLDEAASAPAIVAAQLNAARHHADAGVRALRAIGDLADRASLAPRTVRETIGTKLQALLDALDEQSLLAALRTVSADERNRLTAALAGVLPTGAVVRWLRVAAESGGRSLSPHLLRLLTKMSSHQSGKLTDAADQSIRETALELVEGWQDAEPNPQEHHALLDTLAAWSAQGTDARRGDAALTSERDEARDVVHLDPISHEAIRLVQMACELDFLSSDALQAVQYLADRSFTAQLLEWADGAASDSTRDMLRERAVSPRAMADVLLATPFDQAAARQLLEAVPDAAAPLLLEPLELCTSRTGRRLIYDRLRRAGSAVAVVLRERLSQPLPWYLARNLLGLLRDIVAEQPTAEMGPAGPLLLFQTHAQPQVRREAVRLLALDPRARVTALRRGLDDVNDDVRSTAVDVAHALVAGDHGIEWPADVTSRLLSLAALETLDDSVREKALRAAVAGPRNEVRAALLTRSTRRALLGRVRLAADAPLVRTALQLLAARFADHDDVRPVLDLAAQRGLLPVSGRRPVEAVS